MTTLLGIAALAAITPQAAQAQYAAYLSQFETAKSISGTFVSSGGPVSQPTCSTFRIAPGGRYKIFADSTERHCDGMTEFTYSPTNHSYQEALPSTWTFEILFGGRFCAKERSGYKAASVAAEDYKGDKVTVFSLSPPGPESKIDLIVRASDKRPLALRTRGSQSTYTTEVVELHTDRSYVDESWKWVPPSGAKKRQT